MKLTEVLTTDQINQLIMETGITNIMLEKMCDDNDLNVFDTVKNCVIG